MQTPENIIKIIDRYFAGTATEQEKELLSTWYDQFDEDDVALLSGYVKADDASKERVKQRIKATLGLPEELWKPATTEKIPEQKAVVLRWRNWAAAAVLLLVAGSIYFLYKINTQPEAQFAYTGNVMPGHSGAKLKLSNGNILSIDSLQDGLIATEGNMAVYKENGQIIYKGSNVGKVVFNEIITDKGRQCSAQLPDGSVAWLNAASSLRYPLQFTGNERLIIMTGEASFRVVHNNLQPFRVRVKDQLTEDIGTEFNINAYDDEAAIITTVIEGAASVQEGSNKVLVNAGMEAGVQQGVLQVRPANVNNAIAWRQGLFSFQHADITTVLRQMARWYNVEIRYEGPVDKSETFTGDIKKDLTLADALDFLRQVRVQFRIEEDKRIVVLPHKE